MIRRFVKARPLGAVKCSKCDECKNSGNRVTIEDKEKHKHEKVILCDRCTQKRREWYNKRKDESGLVTQ